MTIRDEGVVSRGSQQARRTLRPDQQAAVDRHVRHLKRPGTRGHTVSACGTGKTLIALRTAEALDIAHLAVAVPSLDLIGQWAAAARADGRREPIIAVSSLNATKHPQLAGAAAQSTNSGAHLAQWLAGHKQAIVLFTYDSLHKIEEAQHTSTPPVFDLMIVDEAHRTAGSWDKRWTVLHDNRRIPADRRLYMTATPYEWEPPRLTEAPTERPRPKRNPATAPAWEAPSLIASMDDVKTFGERLHTYPHADAIDDGVLADYQLIIPTVTNTRLRTVLANADTTAGFGTMSRRTTALHLSVLKAMAEHDLRHVIVYFQQIADAADFARQFPHTIKALPENERPAWADELLVQSINGTHTAKQRGKILGKFEAADRAVITNAQVLGEGVDLPAVDAVVFADRTGSVRRIVQALGRALRKPPTVEVKTASLVIPAYVPPDADPTDLLGTPYESLWLVTAALRHHDQTIAARAPRKNVKQRIEREVRTLISRRFRFDFTLDPDHVAQALDLIVWPADGAVLSAPRRAGLAAAKRYHAAHGHLRVPTEYEDEFGYRLGVFISGQRTAYQAGQLDQGWIAELEELGMIWDDHDAVWAGHMAEVEDYHRTWGHLAIPNHEVGGQFLVEQRALARKGELATDRAAQLREIDKDWLLPYGPDWHRKYHLVRRHIAAGLDTATLHRGTVLDGVKAGSWLHRQFTTWTSLDPGQRKLLTKIGLTPGKVPLPAAPKTAAGGRKRRTFEQTTKLLRLFVERHGRPPGAREWIEVDGDRVMIGPWLAKAKTRRGAGELPAVQERLLQEALATPTGSASGPGVDDAPDDE